MPRRTNDFQQLVTLLHQQLATPGVTVTESRMERLNGELREVDIVVSTTVSGIQTSIFIECRDRGRPADIEWIDQLVGKYRASGGKVVAVSKSGFTAKAKEAAKTAGITTMTIAEATDTMWADWVRNIDRIWFTFIHRWIDHMLIALPVGATRPTGPWAPSDVTLEISSGKRVGTAIDIFKELRRRPGFNEKVDGAPRESDGKIKYTVEMPSGTTAITPDGARWMTSGIIYFFNEEIDTVEVPLSPGEYATRSVATGVGLGTTWKAKVVYVRGEDGNTGTSIRIERLDGKDFNHEEIVFQGVGEPLSPPPPLQPSVTNE